MFRSLIVLTLGLLLSCVLWAALGAVFGNSTSIEVTAGLGGGLLTLAGLNAVGAMS
jgi:hypothetical protein